MADYNVPSDVLVGFKFRGSVRKPKPKPTHFLLEGAVCEIRKTICAGFAFSRHDSFNYHCGLWDRTHGNLIILPRSSYEEGKVYKHGAKGHTGRPFNADGKPVYCYHNDLFKSQDYELSDLFPNEFELTKK